MRRPVVSIVTLLLLATGIGLRAGEGAVGGVVPASNPDVRAADDARDLRELSRRLQRGEQLSEEELARLMRLHHAEEEHVRMVMLPVTVTNKRGRIVRDLDPADFSLFEDRIPQKIQFFSADEADAIHVAFLLDVSGSTHLSGKLEAAKDAIRYFVESLRPKDRFALICFADEQVSWVTEFTSDRDRFLERLAVQEGYGQTALNDVVAATPKLVDESIQGRKAIVLFTDGVDNASRLDDREAIRLARQVSVPIYTIGFTAVPEAVRRDDDVPMNLRLMSTFARETGGQLFAVHDPDELKEATATVLEELRFQYLIGYYPTPREWDGRFRRIQVRTERSPWVVRTRNGYYADP